jgi:hypothetical protein
MKNSIVSIFKHTFLIVGLIVGVLAVGLIARMTHIDNIDFNPSFSDSDIVGNWSNGDSHIQFKENRTVHFTFGAQYRDEMGINSGDGNWHKQGDFNIQITNAKLTEILPELRVIKKKDEYRLIIETDDPDSYDYRSAFKRSGVVE